MAGRSIQSTAREAAAGIEQGWMAYAGEFQRLTRRARDHFDERNWAGIQQDSTARLGLYTGVLAEVIRDLESRLGAQARVREGWPGLRRAYFERVAGRSDAELAETFFNSVTRRLFNTVGVDHDIEFVTSALAEPPSPRVDQSAVTVSVPATPSLARAVEQVLAIGRWRSPFRRFEGDVAAVAGELSATAAGHPVIALEFARTPFLRNKGAYLVGRLHTLAGTAPVAIALVNTPSGVAVDAVLTAEDDISIVFSFSHSYFLVETACPSALVAFLRELMPRKPVSELYASIGHNKHGKTEFYRALLSHLEATDDRFEIAPGARGMVMVVFTMPGFDAVFKIIRDRFEPPKTATRAGVREKYAFVFGHDRAGRLVDAQEFEHLKFDRRRFSPALLDELVAKAAGSVVVEDHSVAFEHVYTERRLTPLDLYLGSAPPALARAAVIDYGLAIRDLAASNIFPGDLLVKNFGVSRHGRVIFYDYDELCLLSECRFRRLPPPRSYDDEISAEPWFHVDDRDVFPEELLTFLGLRGGLRDLFAQAHADLLAPDFWIAMQEEHRAGHLPDIWPYPSSRRLTR